MNDLLKSTLKNMGYSAEADELGYWRARFNGRSLCEGWRLGKNSYQLNWFEDADECWSYIAVSALRKKGQGHA